MFPYINIFNLEHALADVMETMPRNQCFAEEG
jgi:hypothetical protein